MADEKTPVVWDDTTKKHRPLGTGEKMGGLDASSILSSDAGNLITSGSDGLAYLSGSGMVDPRADNLLEESDQGKLQVTVDRIAEWLDGHPQDAAALADAMNVVSADAGNIIVQGTDKGAYLSNAQLAAAFAGLTDAQKAAIAAAVAEKMAAQLADGKTIVASGGKLTSDPTNATVAQKKAINQALADADSGLVVDNSTGKLKVDFSNMPTDKFEELLKGLKMLVPLGTNLHVYVDTNNSAAGDDLIDGRGTQAKPFKTIQAAVNYVTGNYSLGKWRAYIHVGAGMYTENLALPSYSSGAGFIRLESASGSRDVVVNAAAGANGTVNWCATADGAGRWDIHNIEFRRTEAATLSQTSVVTGCIQSSTAGAIVNLYGCMFRQIVPADLPVYSVGYGVRIISADGGGQVNLRHGTIPHSIITESRADIGVHVLTAARRGVMYFYYSTDNTLSHECAVSGSCTVFMSAWQAGTTNTASAGSPITFTGTMAGKKYEARTGSSICVGQNASYFPGDVAGTVEDATYCWYA